MNDPNRVKVVSVTVSVTVPITASDEWTQRKVDWFIEQDWARVIRAHIPHEVLKGIMLRDETAGISYLDQE